MYYMARVQLEFENDNGQVKKKSETYLVNAGSVTDAEAIVHAEFKDYKHDFEVKSVNASKIVKILE